MQPRAELAGRRRASSVDVGVAGLVGGVHRHAGPPRRPPGRQDAGQALGVQRQVGDHVGARPAGQQRTAPPSRRRGSRRRSGPGAGWPPGASSSSRAMSCGTTPSCPIQHRRGERLATLSVARHRVCDCGSADHPGSPGAQPQGRLPRPAARLPHRLHRALRLGQVEPGVRHHLRRGPAALRRVALGVRPAVPRPDGQARRRLHRGPLARRSRSTRSPPRRTPAPRSAPSPRSTTTSACSTPGSATPTARPAAPRSSGRPRSRSSTGSSTLEEGQRFQVLAPVIRGRKGEYVELFRQLQTAGLLPGPGQRRDPHARRPADARQAEEAHHRGGRRPARGEGVVQAPAHRLGRDRARPRQRAGAARLRRPRRPRTPAASSGSPRRWPAPTSTRSTPTSSSRGRSRSTRRSAPAPSATASAPGWRSTPTWSCPTRRPRSARARSSRGARPTSPTTSCG